MQNYKDIDKFITKALKIYGNISMILLFALKKMLTSYSDNYQHTCVKTVHAMMTNI